MTLAADAPSRAHFAPEPHIARLTNDGFTVVPDLLDEAIIARVRDALAAHLGSHRGRNAFEGLATERVYTLVARGTVFEAVTEDARVLALMGAFLQPNFLLTASQAICIYPGEAAQSLHCDDSFYPIPRPRPAISLTLICAVDPFTAQNGATMIIPGSHRWSDAEVAEMRQAIAGGRASPADFGARPCEMPAGAALVMQGTLVHGGGANRSPAPRLAFTNQYCEPWARTQENFFLAIPREQVRGFSPALQRLLGYEIQGSFMGQVTASHPLKSLQDDYTPPVARGGQAA